MVNVVVIVLLSNNPVMRTDLSSCGAGAVLVERTDKMGSDQDLKP